MVWVPYLFFFFFISCCGCKRTCTFAAQLGCCDGQSRETSPRARRAVGRAVGWLDLSQIWTGASHLAAAGCNIQSFISSNTMSPHGP